MNRPPSDPKYLPPRRPWLERKGIIKVEDHEPLTLTGWLLYGGISVLVLLPVYFLR
ncbi:MAG: hypothetical protein AAFW98_01255 [Pseudomonadota bacterium]